MNAPVHHDIEATVSGYRAMIATALVEARERARNDEDLLFIAEQARFSELLVMQARLCLEAENAGADMAMVGRALGIQIGTIHGQFLLCHLDDPIVVDRFLDGFSSSSEQILLGEPSRGSAHVVSMSTSPTRGGHA